MSEKENKTPHEEFYELPEKPDVTSRDKTRNVSPHSKTAARAFVEKLLLWVNEATPEGVLDDIDHILEEHFGTPNHWQPVSPGSKEQNLTCHHDSRYVQMTGHPQSIEDFPLHLWPSRAPVYDELYDGPMVEVPAFQVDANLPRRAELTR